MPPPLFSDLTDPKVLMLMIDKIEKESRLRVRWNNLHKELVLTAADLNRKPTNYTSNDISRSLMVAGLPKTKALADAAKHRRTKPVQHFLKKGKDYHAEATMLPIEKEVKDILMESRVEYLKARATKPPVKKYNFIETTYWRHGWEFGKSKMKFHGPEFGRVYEMSERLRSVTGPHPDPEYYQDPVEKDFCL